MVLGSLNINSLLPHVDEIQNVFKERGIHFSALNETKLDDTCSDAILNIKGYKFGRLDRNRNGGGVAFYCKDTFQCTVRDDSPRSTLELICVEISPSKARPFIIILWYRRQIIPLKILINLSRFFTSLNQRVRKLSFWVIQTVICFIEISLLT